MKPIPFSLFAKPIELSWFAIILWAIHLLFFLAMNPCIDLPVYDDANYFAHAIMASPAHHTVYGDWSPLLLYFAKLLYWLLPFTKLTVYFIFRYFCELIGVFGAYFFIKHFTEQKEWAFWLTITLYITLSFPFVLNAHKFTAGIVLLFMIYLDRTKIVSLWLGIGLAILSLLLRFEYIIIIGGYCAWLVGRSIYDGTASQLLKFRAWPAAILAIALFLWLPVVFFGELSTDRLYFAFGEKFQIFAEKYGYFEEADLPPNASWESALDHFFPEEKRIHSFPYSLSPVSTTISANPSLFYRFMQTNSISVNKGIFSYSESGPLSAFISILVLISALILLIETILRREENQFYWLFLSCLFALTLAPTLITQINRIYLIPAIVWFVGVLPSYWLSKNAFSRHFIISFAALALFFQIPHWNDQLHEETKFLNQKRAEALRIAHEKEQWQSITMAEAHPLFSVAFGEEVAFSNEYDIGWDANGHLRNGHGKGDLIDYILLERPKKSHAYYDEIDHLKTLVKDFGEQVSGLDGYSVWKMNPVPLRVYEDETYAAELTDLRDDDIEEERCIALRWELDEPRCKEFHIWVEIDGSEPQYLGITRDPEDRDFYWNDQKKRLELVMKPFMRGPQFGHSYEFTVYGIPSDEAKAAKPKRLRSRGAIQFEESAAP